MSKFSDLIQKKHEMLKVTMKVDPAACKNGEITHFKEYVGFVLAEKEFEKTYEKLLKQYSLQNEGFFDTVKNAGKAILNKLKDDIVNPFKDAKFNPFVGQDKKKKPTKINKTDKKYLFNSEQIIKRIEEKYLNKSLLHFEFDGDYFSADYDSFKKYLKEYNQYKQSIINTDLNKQINVRNLEKTYIKYITKEIEDFEKTHKTKTQINPKQVWDNLVKYIESVFKDTRPTEGILNKKILWMYILAPRNDQTLSF